LGYEFEDCASRPALFPIEAPPLLDVDVTDGKTYEIAKTLDDRRTR